MPIFDKELIDNVSDRNYEPLRTDLGSPVTRTVNPNLGGFESYGSAGSTKTGLSLDDMSKLTSVRDSNSWDGPVQMIPKSELLSNKRYGMYNRGIDLENTYGLQQGWMSQLANGVVKMGATAVGTFAQSFATIPNTVASLKSGTKALTGGPDGYEGSIDNWIKNYEDSFPNYITKREKEHPYLAIIPGFAGSANFWGNSIIKNIGFTVGAISGALVQDAAIGFVTGGLGEIPLLASQIGKASLWLNKIFTGTNRLEEVLNLAKTLSKTEARLLTIKNIGEAAAGIKTLNGFRYGLNLYGASRTEAGVEARDGYRQVYDELVNHYKLENLGAEPEGANLKEIENYATNAMNTRFGINMAILTVSNAIQFDNLFKSFTSASTGFKSSLTKQIEGSGKIGLVEGSLDVFEKKVAKGLPGKVWESIKPKIPNIFTEGVYEEGGQYAAERGTYDYYTRKYKDPKRKENVNNWDSLHEVINSTTKGLSDQFNTTEGITNMIVGAISAIVTGGLLGKVQSIKGQGKEAMLQQSINSLNQYGLTGILQDKYIDTLNSSGIAKEMDEAAKSGDVYKYKNLKNDMFFNFVNSRISSEMHEVTIEQLNMLKDLSKEDFEKTFGMNFNTSNKKTVDTYVDSLVNKANGIKKTVDSINNTFNNPFTNIVNPKPGDETIETFNYHTFNSWKTDLARYANISPEVKDRLVSIEENITNINPLLNNNLLGDLTKKESLKEYSKIYEEQANQLSNSITEYTSSEDKRKIKNQVKALRTLSEKINLNINSQDFNIKTFEDVLNFELNSRNATKDKVVPNESVSELFKYGIDINKNNLLKQRASDIFDNLSSETGFNKYFEQAKDIASEEAPEIKTETTTKTQETEIVTPIHKFTNRSGDKETLELNKEYQVPQTKLAKVSKISDDRWQLTASNGDITFYSTEEKAKDAADELNQDFADLSKVKIIALNLDGTVKVEDLAGNIQNIELTKLTGYERIKTDQEKLEKDKEDILKQQGEIVLDSGTVGTNDPAKDKVAPEGKIPTASILFISGTSMSEAEGYNVDENGNVLDPKQAAIHIRNQREFLNNVGGMKNRKNMRAILVTSKLVKAYGLEGLIEISYNKTLSEITDLDNVDTGFIAQVFVEQVGDKLFFVDKNGNQIGEVGVQVENLSDVIFQTMRTTSLFYRDGVTPRYRKDQKEEAEAYAAAWKIQRAKIFEIEPSESPTPYGFQVSRGIAKKGDVDNHVAGVLIDEKNEAKILATDQTLIKIPTAGIIAHHTGQINVPNGRPMLVHNDNVEFLNNRKFTKKQAQGIYEVIKQMATEINEQSKAGKRVIINKKLSRFLQNVLYWRQGKTELGSNQINISEDGNSISLAGKTYSIPDISERKDEIIEALENSFYNVNNKTLSAENFSKPFTEYYMKDGELVNNEWKNYQTYLLSSTYPNGSSRSVEDTPLSTKIIKPTPAVPTTHEQKYSTLIGLELPVGIIAKPAKAETVVAAPVKTERKYDYDGETDNIFTTPFGDVIFTIKEGENPKFDKTDDTFIFTRDKIIKKLNDNRIKKGEAVLPEEELILEANGAILAFVKKELETDVIAPVAPDVVSIPRIKLVGNSAAIQAGKNIPIVTQGVFTPTELFTDAQGNAIPKGPELTTTPVSTDAKADVPIGKVGNTNYEVKADGVYFEGKKLDNPENKTHRQLIEADIKRRRQEDVKRFDIKIGLKKGDKVWVLKESREEELLKDYPNLWSQKGSDKILIQSDFIEATVVNDSDSETGEFQLTGDDITAPAGGLWNLESEKFITNLKYDAELGALEGGQVEAPKEPGSFNPNNIGKRDDVGFRKVGAMDRKNRMTEADLKAFKEWHAKNVPFIPFEILENMININSKEKAWGVFEKGVAKFVKGGLRATEYHEIGEGIWNGMLTKDERVALIAEFRNKPGQFLDRETNKKFNYDDPTVSDNMVKERILDDFSDFRLGKLPARSLGEAVLNFFRRILDFVKSFIAKPSLKTELFKAIETGEFKDRQLSTESKSMPPQYRAAGHLTEEQTNAYVKDMMAISSNIIFGSGKMGTIDKSALYNLRTLTSDDVFNMIDEFYAKQISSNNISLREELGDIAWKDLVVKTKQELKTLMKVDFNEDDLVNINEAETNKNDYVRVPFSVDYKKSAPRGIKFATATLLDRVPTNQEDSNLFSLPTPKVNEKFQTFSLLSYTRAFSTMLDAFKNTTSIGKLVNKVVKLGNEDANYVSMFQRLGGFYSTNAENKMEKIINFTKFKFEDWRFFIEFMQTYTKQKPNAIVQYIDQGQVYSGSAMVTGIVEKTTRGWIQNMISLAKQEGSYITLDKSTGTYSITDLSGIPTNNPQEKITFLSKLGVIFPIDAWKKLKGPQQIEFTNAVNNIKTYLQKSKEIMNIKKSTLDVAGQYNTLAELLVNVTHPTLENTRINLEGKQSNSFSDNNVPSVFENEFNEVGTLEELLTIRPELNDLYSRGALLLKKGGQFFDKEGKRTELNLKVGYIEGTKNKDNNKGTSSTSLTEGDRYTQEINQNINGQYYIMIPADGSTEWMMNMGNHVAFEDIEQGKDGWKKINEIFRGYLTDDVALALDADNRIQVENVGGLRKIAEIESKLETLKSVTNKSDRQKEEVKKLTADLEALKKKPYELRFFKDILSEKTLSEINKMIKQNNAQADIESFIDDNIDDVNASIKEYIDGTVTKTLDFLTQNNQVTVGNKDQKTDIQYYRYTMLDINFATQEKLDKNNLTKDDVTNIITFVNANYIINNIEFHKIIFGDPYQFAIKEDGTLDATKRFKSFLSPRRTTIDSPELNTFLNKDMNKAGDVQLLPEEPGYHEAKSWMDTVTVNDVIVAGSIANMQNVPTDIRDAFAKTNEGDASSIMMDGTYRELKIKNGQWNIKGVEEAWHQWQMAYTRQNVPASVFTYSNDARGKALEKHDVALLKTKEPNYKIEVIKPIVSGVTNGSNTIKLVLDKFSQMPLYYSMVKGKNLEKLYLQMMKEKKGYIIMISGRKVGAEALHDLYKKNGEFNDAAFNNNIEVPWKAYGIQVENAYEGSGMQPRGSQITKLSTLDLYENGEPIGATPERREEIAKEVARNREILNDLHRNGYERFLKRLGIEDLGGSYKIPDKRRLAKTLQDEMFRRELSDNVKDSIQLDENGEFIIPFEASPAYLQIKSILYSFIDKEITSPKMNGGSYVQAPVTLWENAKAGRKIAIKTEDGYKQITKQEFDGLSPEEQKKVVLTDDTLKFYEDADGKRYCEIMLPHWFKSKLGKHASKTDEELIKFLNTTKEGKELLSGIGFRIPTQSLSSVEAFKVKSFLPQYMGKTVIVPSEITTKAGSDFDIDKLNMYLKSIYIDKNGEIKIIKLKGTEEATKDFYGRVFDETLENKKINKAEFFEAATILVKDLDDAKNLVDRYADKLDILFAEANTLDEQIDVLDDIMKKLEELGNEDLQALLKEKFVEDSYRRALENEYYDSLENLVTMPENFQRLISPVSDDGLKEIANRLDTLRGYDENKIKNRLLDRNYMTSLRHAFITAKRWIGIAAVNITGHSLTQKSKTYIDPARFSSVSAEDRKILEYGNGEILLDHNTLEKDGKSYISLSGRLDSVGKFISDGLSGFATSFVDVAKNPYILKIIKSDLAVSTFMFLRRVGVSKEQLVMFMNQPIIDEYLTLLDNNGIKTLFDSRYISKVEPMFPSTVPEKASTLGFNKDELEANIKNYYSTGSLGDAKNREQMAIFNEFLKYAKMAEYNFSFTQATNYDTTKFQSGDSLQLKQWRTEAAQEKNIISSVGELLENNFIGVEAEYLDSSMDAMGEALVLETLQFTDVTNDVLKAYEQDKFLSKDKFDRIANKIKASFLDYIIQKRSDIATNLQEQLTDDKESVAQMLVKAKKEYPGVQILEDLEVDSSGRIGGAQTIKLKVNDKIAYTENMYTGMMRELRDNPDTNELYKGIVRLAILQGTYQSPISIKNIIPVEDYAKHITPIIAGLRVDDDIRAFATSNEFQRNEWQDNDVVPIIEPRFAEEYRSESEYDLPRKFQGLFKVIGKINNVAIRVPGPFPTIQALGVNSQKRHLLFINTKYDAKVSNYDVIKMPRAISINKKKVEEGKIDVANGMEITNQTYAEKIKKGDTSLRNYYGYQKVKYADGSPLIASYDRDGNPIYVYKFINLHGDGMYASEYYGDGRPSIFNNGSQKNVRNVEGTLVSNEIPDQDIVDFYGGEIVPLDVADPIIATIEKELENVVPLQPTQPSTSVKEGVQDIIYKSNLEPGEYEVVEINGKQKVIDKRFTPERVKKGFSKFYSNIASGTFAERYGKKIVIPGFEDINLMMEQDTNDVFELSTGFSISTISDTQKAIKEEVERIFKEKNIRKVLADSKKTDINDALLTKIAPEGLPSIDNNNQNNCG
jgi:hypothetical protein